MNSSAVYEYDPDPTSALYMSIWFFLISIIGIPLNIFILIATIRVQEIRSVPANAFIGSLALSDTFLLLSCGLHLPYALTLDETLCRIIGIGITSFAMLGSYIPPCLALNRYSIVFSHQEKLARYLNGVFSRKGIYLIILALWILELIHEIPFVLLDAPGLNGLGLCASVSKYARTLADRLYYYFCLVSLLFVTNLPLLIFYRKVSSWVKTMSLQFSLTAQTKETLYETKSALSLMKWVTLIPAFFGSLPVIMCIVLEFNPDIVSMRYCRIIVCLYPMIPLLNATVTLKFARPYRIALRNICERSTIMIRLFSWIVEGKWSVTAVSDMSVFSGRT